jgi:hypothetical protein
MRYLVLFPFLHFARKLACDHSLDRDGSHLPANSGVFEPAFEALEPMCGFFLAMTAAL